MKILEPKPGVKLLTVKVPKGIDAWINPSIKNFVHIGCIHADAYSLKLPDGNWKTLGRSTEIPEEVCEEFTPYEYDGRDDPNIEGFIYECFDESALTCSTAKESLLSYLISQGVEENSLILKEV